MLIRVKLPLGERVQRVVELPLERRELQIFERDLEDAQERQARESSSPRAKNLEEKWETCHLLRQVYYQLPIGVLHGLVSAKEARFEDELNDLNRCWITLLEGDGYEPAGRERGERSEERDVRSWSRVERNWKEGKQDSRPEEREVPPWFETKEAEKRVEILQSVLNRRSSEAPSSLSVESVAGLDRRSKSRMKETVSGDELRAEKRDRNENKRMGGTHLGSFGRSGFDLNGREWKERSAKVARRVDGERERGDASHVMSFVQNDSQPLI